MSATPAARFIDRPAFAELRALPVPELIARYRKATELVPRRVLDLTDEQLDTFFRPEASVGRWSVRVLLGHLADADLAESHRMRRTVAEDHPLISPWDENAFIDASLYGDSKGGADKPVAGFIAVIHTLRLWTGQWLATLTPEQLQRAALHQEKGEVTVHDMLVVMTWHFEHHLRYLNLKLDKLLGPAA